MSPTDIEHARTVAATMPADTLFGNRLRRRIEAEELAAIEAARVRAASLILADAIGRLNRVGWRP
jgi:hypothetical protein